ncbi:MULTISPECIES: hypothetical protein [Pseudanabaena]|jgi:hypothetical protein|uniref:hypothetical protein n=1 Tax=Pseudanabaena TaxID=1152 RepID=UPI002479236C|nr:MULTISPECIES: hypothetical protein [Pseudanabaena]MEA5488193.1 hypothetical protein [Pseudanabaena sp. CCNP1317]WGS74764.1 hypothetical protein OA858_23500 [Pseudanabaena galeata CCNP1313]
MRLLIPRQNYGSITLKFKWLFLFSFVFMNMRSPALAQAITNDIFPYQTCQQLANGRYAVIIDRPVNQLPQLPEFLAISVVPCRYFTASMTFLGGFENVNASIYRASQIRQMGLDAVVHSFTDKNNDNAQHFRAAALLIEVPVNSDLAIQQVRMLTGKPSFWATFNNRPVILSAPLSSQQTANILANNLRSQGFAAQSVGAVWISNGYSTDKPANTNQNLSSPLTSQASAKMRKVYQLLIPIDSNKNLRRDRNIIPNAFPKIFKGRSYLQVRSYNDIGNAIRERDRLSNSFSGVIILSNQ